MAPPPVGPSPFRATLVKALASGVGLSEQGFRDDEQLLGFRKADLAAFGADAVSFALPPLFLARTLIDRKGWREHPGLQLAMTAFALAGCIPILFAATRLVIAGAEVFKIAAIAATVERSAAALGPAYKACSVLVDLQIVAGAPLMIFQTMATGASITSNLYSITKEEIIELLTGRHVDHARERGELLRASLQLLPLASLYRPRLNDVVWPRREMVRASRIAAETIEDGGGSFLRAREDAMNPFSHRQPIPDPYAPQVSLETVDGRQVLTLNYRATPRRYFGRRLSVLDDLRITVQVAKDGLPAAVNRPKAIIRVAGEWGTRMLLGRGHRRIVHRGIEHLPDGNFTVAQLTHLEHEDIFAIVASGPTLGLRTSQVGKRELRFIPGLREAIETGFLNPTPRSRSDNSFLARSRAHMQQELPEGLRAVDLSYTPGHRTTKPMTTNMGPLWVAEMVQTGMSGTVVYRDGIPRQATWRPSDQELFLPHTGVFRQAIETGTPVVPVTHRFLRDRTVEYTWHRPIDRPAVGTSATTLRNELSRRIIEEIIPGSDHLRFFHPFHYHKRRTNPLVEIVGMLFGRNLG